MSVAGAASLTGCVAQQEYDDTRATAEALEVRVAELNRALETARSVSERRQETIARLQAAIVAKDNELTQLRERLSSLNMRINDLGQQMTQLPTGGMIDAETDAALRQLAADNPSLFSYDPDTGMIRVASDLTFASGSADVQDAARQGLNELADILADAIGQRYDIRVVGHTDSQRMSNPATVRRFQDNRGLSVARAIAVSDALQSAGLPAQRIETSGWGPHRPQVANNPNGGTRENRRVEILIVPTTVDRPLEPSVDGQPDGRRTPTATSPRDIPIK
jgi:flagellar motor protein MotB